MHGFDQIQNASENITDSNITATYITDNDVRPAPFNIEHSKVNFMPTFVPH